MVFPVSCEPELVGMRPWAMYGQGAALSHSVAQCSHGGIGWYSLYSQLVVALSAGGCGNISHRRVAVHVVHLWVACAPPLCPSG